MNYNIKNMIKENPIDKFYIEFSGGVKSNNSKDKYSCIFCGSKDNMSYNKKDNTMHCFGCDTHCDHINLVEKTSSTTFYESLKIAADYYGYEYNIDSNETTVETQEEMQKRKAEFKKIELERLEKKRLSDEKLLFEKKVTVKKLTKKALIYRTELGKNWSKYKDIIETIFFNQSKIFTIYKNKMLGWDIEHDSLVILTYDGEKCMNITHQYKYQWDGALRLIDKTKRMNGKWFNAYNSTISIFFKDTIIKENNIFILSEGGKDAINIISIGGNATTLGGATNKWTDHKEFLRDKIVYIWFDNDKTGYVEAMKRYKELKDVVKEIYIVLFFHINSQLPLKYDISDYIKDQNITSYDKLMESISFSSYKLTNEIVDDIAEYIELDDKIKSDFYLQQESMEFKDITKIYSKVDANGDPINILKVKGEYSRDEIEIITTKINKLKKDPIYLQLKDNLINSIIKDKDTVLLKYNEIEIALNEFTKIKKSMITNHTKHHISDMITSFIDMTKKTGFTFGRYRNNIVIWNGTYYKKIEQSDIVEFILNKWFYLAKIDSIKHLEKNAIEIVSNIKAKSINIDELKLKNKDKRIINLLNGTLFIIKNGKCSFKGMHSKNDGSTNILNFNYDINATCPKWKKFLNRILPDIKEQEALMQFIGCCLLPSHAFETFVILYGKSGANGKSVILDTISNFFGNENISYLDLQQLEGHQLVSISNKYINIGSEINAKGLYKDQLSVLKKIVSPKDSIEINPKGKDPFVVEAHEKPKLIFSTNEKPKQGLDDAVFRRMLLLTFDNEIKDSEKIRDLSDRFKDELSGILNLALEKAQVLIKNGTFTRSQRMKADLEAYKDEVDPMRKYIEENISIDKNSIIPKQFLYAHYKNWIEEHGYKPLNDSNFSKKLKESLSTLETSKSSITIHHSSLNARTRVYGGIYCNTELYPEFEFKDTVLQTNSINFDKDTKIAIVKV